MTVGKASLSLQDAHHDVYVLLHFTADRGDFRWVDIYEV